LANLKMEENYPEDIEEFIEEILKELNLWEKHQQELLKLNTAKAKEERLAILENSPGVKLAKIIRDLATKKISHKNLNVYLVEELNISNEKGREIAEKIIKKLFPEKEELKKEKKVQDIYREPI